MGERAIVRGSPQQLGNSSETPIPLQEPELRFPGANGETDHSNKADR